MDACALIDADRGVRDQLLSLCDADFPDGYRNMAHPEDYIETRDPFPLQVLLHKRPQHNRLLLRVCWRLGDDRFVPVTFVCDTGAPGAVYLSKRYAPGRICLSVCPLTICRSRRGQGHAMCWHR